MLNRRREDEVSDDAVDGSTEFSGPRHRKSSRDKDEKRRLLGSGAKDKEEMIELSEKMLQPSKPIAR